MERGRGEGSEREREEEDMKEEREQRLRVAGLNRNSAGERKVRQFNLPTCPGHPRQALDGRCPSEPA